jgi:hypothetical protein
VSFHIYVYRYSVHQKGCTFVGEGVSNIPIILPNLINVYVDIMCGYGQIVVYAKCISEF